MANDAASMSERIDALEVRLAYQDETIEALNETITAQWQQIDALTRQFKGLSDRLEELADATPGPGNEKPPHY